MTIAIILIRNIILSAIIFCGVEYGHGQQLELEPVADRNLLSAERSFSVQGLAMGGCGPAKYKMLIGDNVVYETTLRYTFQQHVVLASGEVVGFAYLNGPDGWSLGGCPHAEQDLVFALIDQSGKEKWSIQLERTTFGTSTVPSPIVLDLWADSSVGFGVAAISPVSGKDQMWIIDLSSGSISRKVDLNNPENDHEHDKYCWHVSKILHASIIGKQINKIAILWLKRCRVDDPNQQEHQCWIVLHDVNGRAIKSSCARVVKPSAINYSEACEDCARLAQVVREESGVSVWISGKLFHCFSNNNVEVKSSVRENASESKTPSE